MLTVEDVRSYFTQRDGRVFWRVSRGNRKAGQEVTTLDGKGYLAARCGGKHYAAHRLVWVLHYGEWPASSLDHINRDKQDNRVENLRLCTSGENAQNRLSPANATGYAGVQYTPRSKVNPYRWRLRTRGGKTLSGGAPTPEAAHAAYIAAKAEHHQTFEVEHGTPTQQSVPLTAVSLNGR